jgi:soluble lytic murein transglycosylase-like protein
MKLKISVFLFMMLFEIMELTPNMNAILVPNIENDFYDRLGKTESNNNDYVIGEAGERGRYQIMKHSLDSFNSYYGTDYNMDSLVDRTLCKNVSQYVLEWNIDYFNNDWIKGVCAYNIGYKRVEQGYLNLRYLTSIYNVSTITRYTNGMNIVWTNNKGWIKYEM